jgi:hypothetical protein
MDPITPAPQPIEPNQPQSQFSSQPVAPPTGHDSKKKMLLLVSGAPCHNYCRCSYYDADREKVR